VRRYSLVDRREVDDPAMAAALAAAGTSVVASASLAFGALSGKYATGTTGGRIAGELDDPQWAAALAAAEPLVELAGIGEPA
jgi:aryl-alcohol dehydrogenase-like predicted oxidoreductase